MTTPPPSDTPTTPRALRTATWLASLPKSAAKAGLGYGAALAISISWSVNHSLVWALVHGVCGWAYVVAYALGLADQWMEGS